MHARIVEKEIDTPLSQEEAAIIRSKITEMQRTILDINQDIIALMAQIISGTKKQKVKCVEETDEELGVVRIFIDGKLYSQIKLNPSIEKEDQWQKKEQVESQNTHKAQSNVTKDETENQESFDSLDQDPPLDMDDVELPF